MENIQQYITVILIVVTIILLLSDRVSYVAIAMIIVSTLTLSGVLDAKETFGKLADPTMMFFVGSFLISEAFTKVGLTERVGQAAIRFTDRHPKLGERGIILVLSLVTAVAAIVLQALGIQVAMMTLVLTMAGQLGINKKRALLALGYSATIGSTFTLLGNNVNLLAKSTFEAARPGESFGLFQLSPLSIPMGLGLIVFYCFLGMYLIRDTGEQMEQNTVVMKTEKPVYNARKQRIVMITTIAYMVLIAAFSNVVPANIAAIGMAFIFGLTGILSVDEMLGCIQWKMILFAVGITTLSVAIPKVGLDIRIGDFAQQLLGNTGNLHVVVAIVFLFTTLMTQFMSNTGSFAVMIPIGIAIAGSLNLPLKPVVIAICLAGTCAYATPMATPSYAMLASAGDIKFKEFLKVGLPMMALNSVIAIIFIPILFA